MHHTQSAYGNLKAVVVRPIEPKERDLWDHLMATQHYLGFRHLVGESIRYVAILDGQWVGLLAWCSAAYKSGPRDSWVGWTEQQRHKRLKFIVNNSRFLILSGVHIPNLASRILGANLKRLSADWIHKYNHPVIMAETFVDHSRFEGACYKASGFIILGRTKGFRRHNGYYYQHGSSKTIMVRPLHKQAIKWLSTPFWGLALMDNDHEQLLSLDPQKIIGSDGLIDKLEQLPDPRDPRGKSRSHSLILGAAVCACMAGARSYRDLGRWVVELPPDMLRAMGCKISETSHSYLPPSEPTMRRALQAVNPDALEAAVKQWLIEQGYYRAAQAVVYILQSLRRPRYARIPMASFTGGDN